MAIKDVILGYAKGDKGDRGPQGEKGATGATGPKGEPGNIADAQITDTEGLDVAKGQKTTAQKLLDAIANRIVTKLVTNDALTKKLADYMLKGMMSNTNVNNTGTVPTSALMYSMFEQINSDLFSNVALVTDVHNIGKGCLFRAEYGAANTPTSDLGYIGISVYISSSWQFVICSPYAGGKLFFDSVNANGSWIGWKEITFK